MAKITERVFGEEEELTRERLAALALVTLAIPLLMLEQSIRTTDLNIFLMVMASTALFGLVIARLAGVVTRHDRAKQREACLREAAARPRRHPQPRRHLPDRRRHGPRAERSGRRDGEPHDSVARWPDRE